LLYYKRGKLDRAAELLRGWCAVEQGSAVPWTRLAVVQHKLGQHDVSLQSMRTAIDLSAGKTRADLAYLAARLVLAGSQTTVLAEEQQAAWQQAQGFLSLCLNEQPDHRGALWLMAAVRTVAGDRAGLAAQAAAMTNRTSDDPRFHYFAAVSQQAAGDYDAVLESTTRA